MLSRAGGLGGRLLSRLERSEQLSKMDVFNDCLDVLHIVYF